MKDVIRNKARGCLVGAAVGDALGMPTECVSRSEFLRLYGGRVQTFERAVQGHPCAHLEAGQYTDDTQQTILLAQSLIDKKGLDLNDFGNRLANWAHKCLNEPNYNRFAGNTSLSSAMRIKGGVNPALSGSIDTESCGSCMRVAPIGIFFSKFEDASHEGRRSSIPTHNSKVSKDAASAIAMMVNLCTHSSLTPQKIALRVHESLPAGEIRDVIWEATSISHMNPDQAAKIIGVDSSAKSTAGFAVYCFLHEFGKFEAAVVNAANVDMGDSDSIACITGALCGAYGGIESIPKKYLAVENFSAIMALADDMVKTMNESLRLFSPHL